MRNPGGTHVWIMDQAIVKQISSVLDNLGTPGEVVGLLVHVGERPAGKSLDRQSSQEPSSEHAVTINTDRPLIWVHTLGELEIYANGTPVLFNQYRQGGIGSLNIRKLFAYLLHCRQMWVSREVIQDAVWPKEGKKVVLQRRFWKSLSGVNAVFAAALPQTCLPAIDVHRGNYRLNDSYMWTLDIDPFSAVISEADAVANGGDSNTSVSLYSQALGMYGGDYMMDIPYEDVKPGAIPLANWWIELCEEMNAKRRYARRKLAQIYLAQHKPQLVIDICSTAQREPEQDIDDLRALGLLALTAYAEAGHEIEGLRAFDTLKRLLPKDEGGTGRKLAAAADELKERLYGMEKSGRSS